MLLSYLIIETYHPTLDTKLAVFTKNVQMQLSVLTGVSPLRFQNPQVSYDGPNTFYTATMVEQSPSLRKLINFISSFHIRKCIHFFSDIL